jgi:quercetin dioxygenase-like cupin family protein
MAKLQIFQAHDEAWKSYDEHTPLHFKIHHPGSEEDLQLFEIKLAPGESIEVHAHDESEIIYILEGGLKLGAREVGSGSSVAIPGRTLYGFTAGADGVRFLNFRARQDTTFYTKDEFMASRSPRH